MKFVPTPGILMVLALICLGAVFFFPLWQILLDAAQFPGGLQLYIWINKISGTDKYILQNINILNHYIGMQAIHPDSIPELKYFPIVTYVLLGLGALALLAKKAWAYLTWAILLSVLGILGIYDFYLWLYDYGHNLDPIAPIKVEGMSYMPPLLGSKDLLNFHVQSYPHWGGMFLGMAIIFAGLAFFKKKHQTDTTLESSLEPGEPDITSKIKNVIPLLVLPPLLFLACEVKPEPIAYGKDQCFYCKMNIVDPKYGGELVTSKGRIYKFDALECMVPYMEQSSGQEYAFILGVAYDHPEKLIGVDSLHFIVSEDINSPMGANLAAFSKGIYPNGQVEKFDWEHIKSKLSENR